MSHRRAQTRGVKKLLSLWGRDVQAVAMFGEATLFRAADGRYELRGGSPADHAAAREWAVLFQHDAVFARGPHPSRQPALG